MQKFALIFILLLSLFAVAGEVKPIKKLSNGLRAYEVFCDDLDKPMNNCKLAAAAKCGGEFHQIYPVQNSKTEKAKSLQFACPEKKSK